MPTMEKKIDLLMRYVVSDNETERAELKKLIYEALNDEGENAPASKPANVEDVIVDILKEIGTPPNVIGYNYIVYAAELVYADESYLRAMAARLYTDVAQEYDTTIAAIERAIRHAIELTFDRVGMDSIQSIFGNVISAKKGKLTNSEFMAGLANEVDRRMRCAKGV